MTPQTAPAKKPRDLRLDFFRGLAMLVIFIAHVPGNSWNGFIPARFGFSNATELFVFCSGFASALAFGTIFVKRGWWLGTARILHRCWEVYWAHIGLFLAIMALYIAAHMQWPSVGYLSNQGLDHLFAEPARALLSMVLLRWQADYLDILPMYLVILALIPFMMQLWRLHPLAPFAASLMLYLCVWIYGLALPGDPWTGRSWYFNPFAWQLIFFTGFSFGARWLPAVSLNNPVLFRLSALYLLIALPLSFWGINQMFPQLLAWHEWLLPSDTQQTNLHPLRYLHFMALAYVVLSLIQPVQSRIGSGFSRHVVKVGQQSLATFMASLFLARLCGIILDQAGRDLWIVSLVNLAGLGSVVLIAYSVAWFKSSPWNGPKADQKKVPAEADSRMLLPVAPAR
ncbi:MAG: OpgC family protein [Beijerinckiaceae bacterium]